PVTADPFPLRAHGLDRRSDLHNYSSTSEFRLARLWRPLGLPLPRQGAPRSKAPLRSATADISTRGVGAEPANGRLRCGLWLKPKPAALGASSNPARAATPRP